MPNPAIGSGASPRLAPLPPISPLPPVKLALLSGVTVWSGTGVPSASLGATGHFYLRKDGGGAGATHLYFNNAGSWIGIA
jgi:hypothetical protein